MATTDGSFDLVSEQLGAMPVINHFLDRIGLSELLDHHVPANDRRLRVDPGVVLGVVVRNLVLHREPVYALGEWAAPFDPSLLGLDRDDIDALNDAELHVV